MLTIFTTAKPFRDHIAIIQRNALKSWTLLDPDVEVIVFGDDAGSAEAGRDLGLRHETQIDRTELGSIRVDAMFAKAQQLARHQTLCYINCDILLTADFAAAVRTVQSARSEFLIVGRRWDTDIRDPIDFSNPQWADLARQRALAANHQRDEWWIDYFVFSRGLYGPEVPPFAIGRTMWDDWLIWNIVNKKKPVIDATRSVIAIHQNHDYAHHPKGEQGVWRGEEAARNAKLSGGWQHLRTIADASEILTASGLRPNAKRHLRTLSRTFSTTWRYAYFQLWRPVWFFGLDITRPVRNALGLRSASARRAGQKP
jgi:hypothetical protein